MRRRNTDETVAKCLRDNFAGWDAAQTDFYMVDGKCLREQLASDRRRLNSGDQEAPKLGKRYYDALRQRFSPANTPSKRLKAALCSSGHFRYSSNLFRKGRRRSWVAPEVGV